MPTSMALHPPLGLGYLKNTTSPFQPAHPIGSGFLPAHPVAIDSSWHIWTRTYTDTYFCLYIPLATDICACVCACMCVRARACVGVWVCACVGARVRGRCLCVRPYGPFLLKIDGRQSPPISDLPTFAPRVEHYNGIGPSAVLSTYYHKDQRTQEHLIRCNLFLSISS